MSRSEMAEELRKSFLGGEFGGSEVKVTECHDFEAFTTFTIHVGDVDNGNHYHIHVIEEKGDF